MTEAASAQRRGFPVGLTIATAIGVAILIALGVWQVQRLHWKEGLLAHIAALQSAKAVELGPVLDAQAKGRDVDFTRVQAMVPGLANAPFLELYSVREAGAGSRLILACEIPSTKYPS